MYPFQSVTVFFDVSLFWLSFPLSSITTPKSHLPSPDLKSLPMTFVKNLSLNPITLQHVEKILEVTNPIFNYNQSLLSLSYSFNVLHSNKVSFIRSVESQIKSLQTESFNKQ